jgi:hypothetical protein
MATQRLAGRIDSTEHRVDALEGLPQRMAGLELQLVQFREGVRVEFSGRPCSFPISAAQGPW